MENYINVQIAKMPGAMKTLVLEEGSTVADALRVAEIEMTSGYEVRVDNDKAEMNTVLNNNAVVIVTKMIKGN